jgi:glycosyltransferase involved in cell wall biosynthesis
MTSFSIVVPTYRPGGIDMLADSLQNQTIQDYELVLIDDYVKERKGEILTYLRTKHVNVRYVGGSKPKSFPTNIHNVANAINTGFIMSTNEIVILLGDYQWLPPNFLSNMQKHAESMKQNKTCVVIPTRVWTSKSPAAPSNIRLWPKEWQGNPSKNDCIYKSSWIPEGWEFACIGYHWDTLAEINGYPEYIDSTTEHPIEILIYWMEKHGAKAYVDTSNFIHAIDHREWKPSELWHYAKRKSLGESPLNYRENPFDLKNITRGKELEC